MNILATIKGIFSKKKEGSYTMYNGSSKETSTKKVVISGKNISFFEKQGGKFEDRRRV